MKVFVGMAFGWACSRIFRHLNSVRRINAAQQKNIPETNPLEFTKKTKYDPHAHLLTEIESVSSFLDYPIGKYESSVFSAGGYKWRLVIYPEGKHISAYIEMIDCIPCLKVHATFKIFLLNRTSGSYLLFRGTAATDFTKSRAKWGFRKLISEKMLRDASNGYIVDDKCVFGAQVSVVGSATSFIEISISPVVIISNNGVDYVLFLLSLYLGWCLFYGIK